MITIPLKHLFLLFMLLSLNNYIKNTNLITKEYICKLRTKL